MEGITIHKLVTPERLRFGLGKEKHAHYHYNFVKLFIISRTTEQTARQLRK